MRVLICGPRDLEIPLYEIGKAILIIGIEVGDIEVVIHGCCRDNDESPPKGIDGCADRWAKSKRIPVESYPVTDAQWSRGKFAGPTRNARMLREGKPDIVVAIRDRVTRGTSNMLKQAKSAGIETQIINATGERIA